MQHLTQHLDTERLAALADEPATPAETAHLGECLACRRERDQYVALLALAQRSSSAYLDAPISDWEAIARRLRADADLAPAAHGGASVVSIDSARPARRRTSSRWWMRAAASVTIMAGAAAFGRMSAGAPVLPTLAELRGVLAGEGAVDALPASAPSEELAGVEMHPVADTITPSFASVAHATLAMANAQREYLRAAAYIAAHDSLRPPTGDQGAYRARLAALDEMMPTLRAALYEAPQDPVLNQYYLAAYDTRETTLRQLGRALPTGVTLNRY
jgi:hypothetical protein